MEKHSKQMGAPSEHKISTQQPLLGVGLRPIVQKHVVGDSERKKWETGMRTCRESESESNIIIHATCRRKIIQNSFIARGQLFSISCLMAIRKQLFRCVV